MNATLVSAINEHARTKIFWSFSSQLAHTCCIKTNYYLVPSSFVRACSFIRETRVTNRHKLYSLTEAAAIDGMSKRAVDEYLFKRDKERSV